MLLNMYLGTIAISWATVLLFSAACEQKLKRKGYKFIKPKKSFVEKLASFLSAVFKNSIPVYNILNAITIIFMGDKTYDYMEDKLLELGKIYIPKDEPAKEPEIESLIFEKEQNNIDNKDKVNAEKKYEDMSYEEKMAYLEREKEILLSQKESIDEEGFSKHLDQKEHVLIKTFKSKKR